MERRSVTALNRSVLCSYNATAAFHRSGVYNENEKGGCVSAAALREMKILNEIRT